MPASIDIADKNLGLSPMEYEQMLLQMRDGNESLFEKLFHVFFKKSLALLKGKYRASHEDAYDSVMWAMLRMRQLMLEGKVQHGNLKNYFNRMAITHYLKSKGRNREYATEHLPEFHEENESRFDEEVMARLDAAWSQLNDRAQQLLKGFYYDKIPLKKLTVLLGDTSEANTRKRKERCLNELKGLFFETC